MRQRTWSGWSLGAGSFLAAVSLTAGQAQGQAFVLNNGSIPATGSPQNNTFCENIDFADVDLDGDLDSAQANGGDLGPRQNTIWMNQGPSNIGVFVDETATRFPVISDASRDIEFVDYDSDGDEDIYVSNTSQNVINTNRFWTNGGLGSGSFIDETQQRWLDLGVNDGATKRSSIQPGAVLPNGGFIDWSCDCDFADIDNDGDLDLMHSTYGSSFNGEVPSRIFLNDGAGNFFEFNPSGVQLTGTFIPDGTPALWAEGVHQDDTQAFDGSAADIAGTPPDVDFADIDNDLDLDILLGSRNETPRFFMNMLDDNASLPPFRDVTYMVLPQYGFQACYEQEMGDVDNDGDVDLWGINYDGLWDTLQINDGNGFFGPWIQIEDSNPGNASDSEIDFFDYDNDGDNDAIIAVFRGDDRLYENDGNGNFTNVTATQMPTPFAIDETALDIDVADLDNDGDLDMFCAQQYGPGKSGNIYYLNVTQIPDTHGPSLYRLEQAPDRSPSLEPTVVRVQVYDNAPYYVTYRNTTWLEVTVDGGPVMTFPMKPSGGQIFRGEIPGTLTGTICYAAYSEDRYGNQGSTAQQCYTANEEPVVYCTGKVSSAGCVATIGTSSPTLPTSGAADYFVTATNVQEGKNGIVFLGITGPTAVPFVGATLCVNPPLKRGPIMPSGGDNPVECDGSYSTMVNDGILLPTGIDPGPGATATYQYWYRDPNNGAGQLGSALTDAVLLNFN